ncbi:MAG: hypothetical protein DCC55_26720 [Chloroflexi bacterium]|nr:MAG: hypothetical protein DCC55_26720 [Chloroflexota bacterium]
MKRWWWPAALAVLIVIALVLLVDREEALRLFPARDWTWQAMQSRGVWRVGLDPSFPPFEQLNEAGHPVGFDVDLAHRLAEQWNMEVEIVAIGFDSLFDAVRTGQVDSVVSAYPYDPRLTRDVRFSTPYFDAGIRLAVRADSPLQEVSELAGQTVAVEWGSMSDMVGRRLQRELPTLQLAQYATPAESVQALLNDPAVSAALVDNVTLRQAEASGLPLKAVGPVLESNPYVIVMPRTGRLLQERVEEALQTLRERGTLDALEQTWFATMP